MSLPVLLAGSMFIRGGGLPTGGVCLLGEGDLPTKGLVTRGGMAAPTDKAFSTHPTGIIRVYIYFSIVLCLLHTALTCLS